MITLIIVDCQDDFISGTMTVNGAKKAIEEIKQYIKDNRIEIEKIIFTCDWHIYDHPSFKRNGGIWPTHCVQHTHGACIDSKLLKLVQGTGIPYEVYTKGEEVEQYGAFEDIEITIDVLSKTYYFNEVSANVNSDFVVCGIAGDYCVKATLENMISAGISPKVFSNGIASIDGGKIIDKFIKNHNLEEVI